MISYFIIRRTRKNAKFKCDRGRALSFGRLLNRGTRQKISPSEGCLFNSVRFLRHNLPMGFWLSAVLAANHRKGSRVILRKVVKQGCQAKIQPFRRFLFNSARFLRHNLPMGFWLSAVLAANHRKGSRAYVNFSFLSSCA